jgi:hypothetical protein
MRENKLNKNILQKLGKYSMNHEIWKCNQKLTDTYGMDASLSLVQSSKGIQTPRAKKIWKAYENQCMINSVVCFGTGHVVHKPSDEEYEGRTSALND